MIISNENDVLSRIDPLHVSDLHNSEHSSYFFQTETYTMLITRFLTIGDNGLEGISTPFVIFENLMYMYDRFSENFILMQEGHASIHHAIKNQLAHNEELVEHYVDQVEQLEDSLYARKISPIFLDVWFDLKKDLTRIERMLERTEEVLKKYMQHYGKSEGFPTEPYTDILEHLGRYQRLSELNAIKLDTLYSYYNSLKNDKINNNIYVLTVLSGIFLPLNLVVGFFGMNTEGLFFSGNANGTQNVLWILFLLFIALLAFFPLVRFLEHYILSKLLSRFNVYSKLLEKIKKFTRI